LGPTLFKSNRDELATTFGLDGSEGAIRNFARQLLEQGCKHLLVTDGASGAQLFQEDRITVFKSPKVTEVNPVGSGDAMLGGILSTLEEGKDMLGACMTGVAAGAANAAILGVCDFEAADVKTLAKQVSFDESSW
jgi:1-phosphofructokinase